ncbi:MAG: hypothetical protein PHX36_11385 [Mesotoga sp.]|uniref:hypothetical protein n=1 Tax=Mesotoga sp. TaxID=2053577 RepID=UPI00262D8EBC|nr:hypothetical protein [Mesotoga sp.]MDD3682115.1 hypothetical protein [Mesotoga sp.]
MRDFAISMDSDPDERGDCAFMVVDITRNQTPALVGRTPCQGFYRDLFGIGNYLVCSGNSEVDIYNAAMLPEVSLISHFKGFGGKKIAPDVHRDLIFVLNEVQGVGIISIAEREEPKLLSHIYPGNLSEDLLMTDIALFDNHLLLLVNDLNTSSHRECLLIYDVTSPESPQMKERVSIAPCKGNVLAIKGERLYISGFNNLMIRNVNDINESGRSALVERDGTRGVGLIVYGDFAYLVEHEWALRSTTAFLNVVDLRVSDEPKFMGKTLLYINFLSDNQDVSMRKTGERLILVSNFGLRVIDVSDPADPDITHLFRPSDSSRIASGLEILTFDRAY